MKGPPPPHPSHARGGTREGAVHEFSHGEAFLQLLARRASPGGRYVLDEPDVALSSTGTLSLVTLLLDVVAGGAQVLLATHSPVLAALPGARILEVGTWGIRETSWEALELTENWRAFLDDPAAFLRHLG